MKKKLITLLGIVCLVLILVACAAPAPAPAPAPAAKPVKIGNLACFTGHSADANPWMLSGAELAIYEFGGEVAGRPIELINEDSASDVTIAVDKARKMLEVDKVDVLIGPLPASAAAAVSAFLVESRTPHLGICENMLESIQLGDHVFAHDGTHRGTGYVVGLYAYDVLGLRTATVMHDDIIFAEEFVQGGMDAFVSRGGKIIQRQRTPMDTMDYGPYLTAMKKTDAIMYWFVPHNAFRFINQYYEYGYDMPLLQTGCTTLGEQHLRDIGDNSLGMISAASYDAGIDTPAVREFVDRWVEVNGHKAEEQGRFPAYNEGLTMYMSVRLVLEAIKATNGDTTPAVLRKALSNLKADSPWGPVSFNEDGVGIGNKYVLKVVKIGDRYTRTDAHSYEQIVRDEPAEVKGAAPKM